MTRLAVAITDFAVPLGADSAPRLEVLERFLARGRRQSHGARSWRHWLLSRCGVQAPPELPLGSALAGDGRPHALVTPVHLLAGLEHVHLDPGGVPRLDAGEWRQLVDTFNDEFAGDGFMLRQAGDLGLLSLPRPLDVLTHDPQALAGRDAGRWQPDGPDGGGLRRAMTGFQMWLHDHPLNADRAARATVPVNALWVWGAGTAPLEPAATGLPPLLSDDLPLRRAWAAWGGQGHDLPAAFAEGDPVRYGDACVALSLAALDADPREAMAALERGWLAPVEQALGAGRIHEAALFLDGVEVCLARRDRLRFWQRPQAWYEVLR